MYCIRSPPLFSLSLTSSCLYISSESKGYHERAEHVVVVFAAAAQATVPSTVSLVPSTSLLHCERDDDVLYKKKSHG